MYRGQWLMKHYLLATLVLVTFLIAGCNGTSGKNDTTSTESPVATTISIALYDSANNAVVSFEKSSTVTVNATVLDQSGLAISGLRVSAVTDLGTITSDSALTDSSGNVSFTIVNDALIVGAGTITISAVDLSASTDFEFVDNTTSSTQSSLSSALSLDGSNVNQFKADQTALITATLVDNNNQPISGEIIQFTADVGTLSTNSALTDANGTAKVTLTGVDAIGAGVITASFIDQQGVTISNRINYQIVAADTVVVDSSIRIGHFDDSGTFTEGKVALSIVNNTLSAGGTMGVSVDLIDSNDQLITTPTPVTFTSNCVASSKASIDATVFTVNGSAKATFQDINCAGITGTDDVIIASITTNQTTVTASENIAITGEQLGSIEFVSATPTSIVLQGTGGQGKQETAIVTFLVKSALGNAVAQQPVEFSLNTMAGGITLNSTTGITNSQGLVSAQVSAGTVPTAVRVSATATLTNNGQTSTVQSQSDLLSINTGLPEQRSITLSVTSLNPEADQFTGETVDVTAWLADNFNNPVPDGTTVNFTTEGGVIEPSCATTNGRCTVTWTSAEPRVADHRITILATAIGHESFFDTNGNNSFDTNDGAAISSLASSSGFERIAPQSSGFVDMTEAWRDDNENKQYDAGEIFLDFNNDNTFSSEDGLFNGPQCQGTTCADVEKRSIHVRKALALIMSGSQATLSLTQTDTGNILANSAGTGSGIPAIADGTSLPLTLYFSDIVGQALPKDTTVSINLSAGELAGTTSFTMPNSNMAGTTAMSFVLNNPVGGDAENATLTITVLTPKGIETSLVRTVALQ
jgi:hypothetical protein